MRVREIRWEQWSIDHISQHDVSQDEVEDVVYDRRSQQRSGRHETFEVYGRTLAGRHLLVIMADEGRGVAFIVTARDMDRAERRLYDKRTSS